jgi:hypothetical protein
MFIHVSYFMFIPLSLYNFFFKDEVEQDSWFDPVQRLMPLTACHGGDMLIGLEADRYHGPKMSLTHANAL